MEKEKKKQANEKEKEDKKKEEKVKKEKHAKQLGDEKGKISEFIKKEREALKDLAEKSLHCFKQLFKFTNGMICLSCDANYKSFITE